MIRMERGPDHPQRGVDMSMVFYDGEAPIVNDVIEFSERKAHWKNRLYVEGWRDVEDDVPPRRSRRKETEHAEGSEQS
jgi:hypothetical protein